MRLKKSKIGLGKKYEWDNETKLKQNIIMLVNLYEGFHSHYKNQLRTEKMHKLDFDIKTMPKVSDNKQYQESVEFPGIIPKELNIICKVIKWIMSTKSVDI